MKVTGLLYYLNEGHVLQSSTSFMDGGCCVDFARGMKKEVWQLSLRVCPWLNIKRRLKVAGREREKEGVRGWVEKWQCLINLVPYQWNYLLLHVATGNSAARLIPRPASCLPQYSPLNGPWGRAGRPRHPHPKNEQFMQGFDHFSSSPHTAVHVGRSSYTYHCSCCSLAIRDSHNISFGPPVSAKTEYRRVFQSFRLL